MSTYKERITTKETIREIQAIQDALLSTMDYITELLKDFVAIKNKPYMGIHRGLSKT